MTTMQSTVMDRLELGGSVTDREPTTLRAFGGNVLGAIKSVGEKISRAQLRFEVAAASHALTAQEIQMGTDYGTFPPSMREEFIEQGKARSFFDARS